MIDINAWLGDVRKRCGSMPSATNMAFIWPSGRSATPQTTAEAPDIIDRVVVVWLGGHSLEWPDTYEFNLRQDIGGAQVLFDCGVPVVLLPCRGVVSHLLSTVPKIERYVEPFGEIGHFLAARYKEYSNDHVGWSKEIWDMAPIGWLLNPDWCPSSLVPTPILTEIPTWSVGKERHLMRYVYRINRDAILKDFFAKLSEFAGR